MKLVVGVARMVLVLFLVIPVAAQVGGLSRAVAPQSATTQYDSGDPTPEEQLVLEYINRARADPWAEGVRLRNDANYLWQNLPNATGPSAVGVRPPLAMNKALLLSARFHNEDMYNNSFIGHQDTYYGSIPNRLVAFGYHPWNWGENIAGGWGGSPTTAEDMLMRDGDCLNRSACGHRINLFDSGFEEAGIGWLATSQYLTQNFGSQRRISGPPSGNAGPFLVGVVYDDVNGNNFYDIGEGISEVTITPSTGTYYAVSSTSGGYVFPIGTSGTITVTASGSGLGLISKTVSLTGANIKLDFTLQDHSASTATSTGKTQTSTTTSKTHTTTSTSETQAATSTIETETTTSTIETQAATSTSETQTTTSTSETQTTTNVSETDTTASTIETQTTTSDSETQTSTNTSGTSSSTSTSETQTVTTTSEAQATTSTGETQTTTVETSVTSPTSITSIVTTETTTNVALSLPPSPPRCVIATATFGSVWAPEVVYMRFVRDQLIGSTPSGRTLVEAFNTFYYIWSPAVAEVIAGNGLLRAIFRIILLPLVGIVHASAMIFSTVTLVTGQTDHASVFAFVGAAVMTISVYIALPIAAVAKSRRTIRGLQARFRRSGLE